MRAAALGVVLFLAGACAPPGDVEVGARAPLFAASDLSGERQELRALRGDVVLLNVWATWCHPCRREMPGLEELHRQLRHEGLHVLGVTIDAAGADAEIHAFLSELGVTFEVLHDPRQHVTRAFRTRGVPETFLIGRDGSMRHHWIGRIDARSELVRGPVYAALDERT